MESSAWPTDILIDLGNKINNVNQTFFQADQPVRLVRSGVFKGAVPGVRLLLDDTKYKHAISMEQI